MRRRIVFIVSAILIFVIALIFILVNGNHEKTYELTASIDSISQGHEYVKQILDDLGVKSELVSYSATYTIKDFENEVKPLCYEYEYQIVDSKRNAEEYFVRIDLINNQINMSKDLVHGRVAGVPNEIELPELSRVLTFLESNFGQELLDDIRLKAKDKDVFMQITKTYFYKDTPVEWSRNIWNISFSNSEENIENYESYWDVAYDSERNEIIETLEPADFDSYDFEIIDNY